MINRDSQWRQELLTAWPARLGRGKLNLTFAQPSFSGTGQQRQAENARKRHQLALQEPFQSPLPSNLTVPVHALVSSKLPSQASLQSRLTKWRFLPRLRLA